ncbi:glycosyltransferase family 2 protein [Candidatus Shapirobacteria bacterium CG09_land_8_20_14_0_10_39_12]|uniref:Glycosyltransferase family 2 protein n=1 Tax=Candidatus Shapirobacteria bacterium CG09_land_8_20_14_0_10_39_12 TaxID=1974885 RepID=A0A2H0WPL9_9BACT|nr:MAG: glycosyltransferase family 2 protein [Candidatus Shapirobacteria bacterium CG09_land_8_20_14_0_10_39_12]
MDKLKGLSLFFPAYNEEANLANTVEKAIPILKSAAEKYELLIINDGSKDKTGEVAEKLAKKYSFVRVIHHNPNRGYGAAIKSGLYASKYDWIVFTDSDGQFDFSEVNLFIEKQRETEADLVIGYYLKRAVPFVRIVGSKLWEVAVFVLFGMKVTDTDCGFKMIKKEVVEKIPKLEAERGPFISSEFLIKSKQSGFKIKEVGVHHYPRKAGAATGASLKVIFSGLSDLVKLRFKV